MVVDEMFAVAESLRSDTEQTIHKSVLGDDVALANIAYLAFTDHRQCFDSTQRSMGRIEGTKY